MSVSFKSKLIRGNPLFGTIITLPSPEIAKIICMAGFDWVLLDLEPGDMYINATRHLHQVLTPVTPCLIRSPSIEDYWINKALSIGATGIILPRIKTADDARRAVSLCKYPLEGIRSIGYPGIETFGESFLRHVDYMKKKTTVVIQIDNINGVTNIEKILEISGIDCLFVWPPDLSLSMRKDGLTDDKEIQNAIMRVKNVADKANVPTGIFGRTAEELKCYREIGFNLMALCTDTMFLENGAKAMVRVLK
jgi:2-keto-3-deoxy-L-rhamnonate aldolase RhmA